MHGVAGRSGRDTFWQGWTRLGRARRSRPGLERHGGPVAARRVLAVRAVKDRLRKLRLVPVRQDADRRSNSASPLGWAWPSWRHRDRPGLMRRGEAVTEWNDAARPVVARRGQKWPGGRGWVWQGLVRRVSRGAVGLGGRGQESRGRVCPGGVRRGGLGKARPVVMRQGADWRGGPGAAWPVPVGHDEAGRSPLKPIPMLTEHRRTKRHGQRSPDRPQEALGRRR